MVLCAALSKPASTATTFRPYAAVSTPDQLRPQTDSNANSPNFSFSRNGRVQNMQITFPHKKNGSLYWIDKQNDLFEGFWQESFGHFALNFRVWRLLRFAVRRSLINKRPNNRSCNKTPGIFRRESALDPAEGRPGSPDLDRKQILAKVYDRTENSINPGKLIKSKIFGVNHLRTIANAINRLPLGLIKANHGPHCRIFNQHLRLQSFAFY